jgi:hypothetical protein
MCLAAVAVIGAAACIDLSTDPDEIVAIEFVDFPWPSVVAGDTLRDASGAAVPLRARLFAGDGSEVIGGPVDFLVEDGGVRVEEGDYLVADDTTTGVARLRASTTGVQSVMREIDVVPDAPDSLAADGTVTPLQWVVPDNPEQNTSAALGVRLLALHDEEVPTGVASWIVTFELEANGVTVPPADTSTLYLVSDAGRPSAVDTTDSQGRASRRVRVRIAPGFTPPDTVFVTVRAARRGVPVGGSPIRLVLPLNPR